MTMTIDRLALKMTTILVVFLTTNDLWATPNLIEQKQATGQVAYASFMNPIKVDGDFSDWPPQAVAHPITRSYFGNNPKSEEDLSAQFRVGYNPGLDMLYVAVEVRDDEHITEKDGVPWYDLDGCVLYLDATHSPRGSGPVAYAVTGTRREMPGPVGVSWDPQVRLATWKGAQALSSRKKNTTRYEWAVHCAGKIEQGTTLGLDLVIIDLDADDGAQGGSYLAWGPQVFKNRQPGRCGDLLLQEPGQDLVALHGSVLWDGKKLDSLPSRVRITSIGTSGLWFHARIDGAGRYSLDVPEGEYFVSCPDSFLVSQNDLIRLSDDRQVKVKVNAQSNIAPEIRLSRIAFPKVFEERGVLFDYDKSKDELVSTFVKKAMQFYEIPGVSLALIKDKRLIYHKAFGVKNVLTQEPVTSETLFEAASITKIVFAFAVNRLAERGRIELDKPLFEYLPFRRIAHDERSRLITARLVLTHQTGLPNWGPDGDSKIRLRFTPGTKYAYSGEAFEYLARVVAHIEEKSLKEILEQEVQIPMGITTNIFFSDSPQLRSLAAHGHRLAGATFSRFPSQIGVAHSMFTEARVFANFMIGLLKEEGLSAATYRAMLSMAVERPQNEIAASLPWHKGFGLGFMLMDTPFGRVFGHDGNNGDFRCNFEAYQDRGAGFVVFTNSSLGGLFANDLRTFLVTGSRK